MNAKFTAYLLIAFVTVAVIAAYSPSATDDKGFNRLDDLFYRLSTVGLSDDVAQR